MKKKGSSLFYAKKKKALFEKFSNLLETLSKSLMHKTL